MKYYVWLEYYAAAPVSKNVKSDELKYYDGHNHGVQPTASQTDTRDSSLKINAAAVYTKYNKDHPTAHVAYPGDAAVVAGRVVKTRSEK